MSAFKDGNVRLSVHTFYFRKDFNGYEFNSGAYRPHKTLLYLKYKSRFIASENGLSHNKLAQDKNTGLIYIYNSYMKHFSLWYLIKYN